ncbi:MAG: histidine kinase dimerization/phospho-acceptor domain-containing protein [Paraglaciecola polaris]|uniref:histidine kinase dimerization/phospho-acceptor domain-containing protein n=1 Tax=Paraglaciecola polaris TaxID=222814 RepID=UPI0030039AF6
MSLRLRLTILIAAVFLGFWLISSIWLITGLRSELEIALDQRLQSTATMLSNIIATVPQDALGETIPSIMEGNELGNAKGLSCQISSLHGSVIVSSHKDSFPINTDLKEGFALLSSDNSQWRTYALRTNKFVITIADKISERESLHFNLLKSTLIPPAIALLVSLALLWIAVGRGLLPIGKLAFAVAKRGRDDLSPVRLDKPSRELQPLIISQNALMSRLSDGIAREQQFTNNAAHELRTPLTGILTQIQLAELSPVVGRDKALAQAKKSAHRLNTILDNLLALARVESEMPLSSVEAWSLEEMFNSIKQEVAWGDERIRYMVSTDQEITFIALPLIAIVCRNLIENALKYGEQETPISLFAQSSSSGIKIEVKNTGKVCAEDIPHMTSRFWRKGGTKGAGLGLSIVNAIAIKYKGSLVFKNKDPNFIVTFYLPI